MTDTPHTPWFDADAEVEPLTPAAEQRLAHALRAAFAPPALDPARHEQLLVLALEEPLAPASAEELAASERLRRALEGDGAHPALALAQALNAAHAPTALVPRVKGAVRAPRRARGLYLRFGAAVGAVALAALALLSLRLGRRPTAASPDLQTLTLAQSRSTASLFESTTTVGPPSRRIDRIVSLRERELRENRYVLWGVR